MLISADVSPVPSRRKPPIANGVLGIIIFIVTEVMFFAALISAYLVLRSNTEEWPPWGQPRLPAGETAFNSLALLLSGWILFKAQKAFSKQDTLKARKLLGVSIFLGVFFLVFQGYEWAQLINFGLTMTSSTYGGLFYLVIGTHGLHAIVAVLALIQAYFRFSPNRVQKITEPEFLVPQVFWYFVVGVWPILYFLVYLA